MGRRSSSTAPTEVGSRELTRETRPGRSRWPARQVEARAMRRVSVHRGAAGRRFVAAGNASLRPPAGLVPVPTRS
jgi:hypothetical protein